MAAEADDRDSATPNSWACPADKARAAKRSWIAGRVSVKLDHPMRLGGSPRLSRAFRGVVRQRVAYRPSCATHATIKFKRPPEELESQHGA